MVYRENESKTIDEYKREIEKLNKKLKKKQTKIKFRKHFSDNILLYRSVSILLFLGLVGYVTYKVLEQEYSTATKIQLEEQNRILKAANNFKNRFGLEDRTIYCGKVVDSTSRCEFKRTIGSPSPIVTCDSKLVKCFCPKCGPEWNKYDKWQIH